MSMPVKKAHTNAQAGTVRTDYALSLNTFARITRVPEATLAAWEAGGSLDDSALAGIHRIGRLLSRLARVMQKTFISTWLVKANDSCKEVGARAPVVLLENGDYRAVEDMVFYLESGVPG
jgi:hypothetical protein